jgi:hypothetical protein
MSLFKKTEVHDVKNATVTVGDQNIVMVSQKISEVQETSITNEGEKWSEVVDQIASLQRILRGIPDNYEGVRDQELLPLISRAKAEAAKLKENPNEPKRTFLDSFKSFCESFAKVAGVAVGAGPIIVAIANLIGIPIPPLPN